jgi:hypothetical protein
MFVFWITVQYSLTWQKLDKHVSLIEGHLLYNVENTAKEQKAEEDRVSN